MDPHTPSTHNFCWQFLLLTEIQFGTFPAKNPPASQGRSTDGIGDRWSALGLFDVERWAFGDFQRPWYLQGRSSVVFVFCFVFFLRINLLNPSWKGEWTYRSRFLKIAFTFEWSGSWGLKDGEWIQNVFYMENFRCNFCRLPFERQINSTAHLVATVIWIWLEFHEEWKVHLWKWDRFDWPLQLRGLFSCKRLFCSLSISGSTCCKDWWISMHGMDCWRFRRWSFFCRSWVDKFNAKSFPEWIFMQDSWCLFKNASQRGGNKISPQKPAWISGTFLDFVQGSVDRIFLVQWLAPKWAHDLLTCMKLWYQDAWGGFVDLSTLTMAIWGWTFCCNTWKTLHSPSGQVSKII